MLYLALYCTNTIILLINIFWEKMPEKWMTKDFKVCFENLSVQKNSCDHISLNTYKSLLRTGSMSRPKNKKINIYTCIKKKYGK
jgi:hypothetical protein